MTFIRGWIGIFSAAKKILYLLLYNLFSTSSDSPCAASILRLISLSFAIIRPTIGSLNGSFYRSLDIWLTPCILHIVTILYKNIGYTYSIWSFWRSIFFRLTYCGKIKWSLELTDNTPLPMCDIYMEKIDPDHEWILLFHFRLKQGSGFSWIYPTKINTSTFWACWE